MNRDAGSSVSTTLASTETAATFDVVEMVQGNPDAPVQVLEYASYTCPHCASFHANQYQQIKENYIDTDLIGFTYREVYFDQPGLWASMVARCGGEMRFFGISNLLYENQQGWARAGDGAAISAALASNCELMTPLSGLKVVELARILAGPWAGQLLADMGADVIKVEAPQGDDTRRWGPPFIDHQGEASAAYFHSCNRGKKSVVIDFRTDEGKSALLRLLSDADVLIENFKVGGLAKYGLDYATLKATHPRLIYCSITGFGQDGPYAARAGYDYIIQATAILAALYHRHTTGQGQQIDLALLDVAVATTANQAMNYLATGVSPERLGNAHPNIVPYQVFECSDGHVIIAVGNDGQFKKYCAVLGVENLATDVQFAANPARLKNRDVLVPILAEKMLAWTKAGILGACEEAGVPAGPINTFEDVFADPQVLARELKLDLDGALSVRPPMRFSEAELALDRPAPTLGQDQDIISE
ncbi:CaiB/baiF CoA-transferase family protein [Nymphon striatum]|nr:CaiB/baiF CoA-transferase family protein [Nymphon striatum]